jgi:hypothetical protein
MHHDRVFRAACFVLTSVVERSCSDDVLTVEGSIGGGDATATTERLNFLVIP